jgi:hypothetical protein
MEKAEKLGLGAVVHRVLDWFWLTSAERAARVPLGGSARVLELSSRAALAYEAGQRTLRPAEPFAQMGAEALASELFREAIHAALAAHLEVESPGVAAAPVPDLASLEERIDAALIARLGPSGAQLTALRAELGAGSYLRFAELSAGEQKQLAARFEALCGALLDPLSGVRHRLERIWARRVLHLLGLLAAVLAVVWSVQATLRWRREATDLAPRAGWTLSSNWAAGGCKSPEQVCVGGESYFFHTGQEPDPWIRFDLGKERRVSGVSVENRRDCCTERADPLVVAVSSDGKKWSEVARHSGSFTEWTARFPSTKARYVKLHVPGPPTVLHLSRVRIYP